MKIRRSVIGSLPIALSCVCLAAVALASCADSTAPSGASKKDSTSQNPNVLQIQGTVRLSSGNSAVQHAVVRVMVSTDVGTSDWATDTTTTDGTYAVQVEVPGGCAGRDSVSANANAHALGYPPSGVAPKLACVADAQTLDLVMDPPPATARTPQLVSGGLAPTGVDAGRQFACAATASGVSCWGVGGNSSALGQDPGAGDLTQPRQVTDGGGLSKVSAADKTACGLDQDGAAWCWGADDWGNLGVPDSTLDFPLQEFAGHAMAVQTDLRFTQVAAGTYTVCGLTSAGAVYCWGNGALLGAGDSLRSANIHPTPARVISDRTFVQVGEGYESTCALDDGGNAWCWGRNNRAQVGDPQAPEGYWVTLPQQVVGGHQFVSLAVGGDHACGLTTAGEAWCWGSDSSGQLGDGKWGLDNNSATPVAVAGGHAFTALAGGLYHTCGLTADGTAYCWGGDESGQLGLGDPSNDEACGTSYCAREPRPVAGGLTFSSLGAGADLTCGIATDGKLYCWGLKQALGTG